MDVALRDYESRFHLLLDTLPHIAFVIAPGGQAEYYNQAYVAYHGFRPGPEKDARTALLHPEDQAPLIAARQSAAASQTEYIVEARLRRHDGAYRWHRIHNKPLLRGSQLGGWLGTAVDIHDARQARQILEQHVSDRTVELRRVNDRLTVEIQQRQRTEDSLRASEARYRLLYNRTPMALHSTNADARLIDVNDTWLEMFGYSRDEVIGRSPADFMTPDSAERYRTRAWPEMLASGGQLRVVDYEFLTKSGHVFDGRIAATGEFDPDGAFVRTWSAIADVTAEKRADRDLRRAQRMDAVGQLTAGIAHDFNNLLTAILGNLELLANKRAGDSGRAERLIAGAKSAADRGAKLTGQLLAFSRQQAITVGPVDLNRTIQTMLPLLDTTVGSTIPIEVRLATDIPSAQADSAQLELAIMNLTINARDAMLDGGAIVIETATADRGDPTWPEEPPAGRYVSVSVSDTGSGLTESVRERMFEPFFTTKGVGKGTGLGLSHVLGVIKQLGGGLAVHSTVSQGTCVSVFLPPSTLSEISDTPAATTPSEGTPSPTAHILLVDDDPSVRSIAADMLLEAGHPVAEAASAAAALDALAQGSTQPDLILADIAMPGINGLEFAKIVRRTWPSLPVVLMTGYASSSLVGIGDEHDILRKPFQAADLVARVRRALSQARRSGRTTLP